MLEVLVLALVRREDNVTAGDEEPLVIHALGNEEAANTLSPRRRLGTDEETERSGTRFVDIYGGFGREGVVMIREWLQRWSGRGKVERATKTRRARIERLRQDTREGGGDRDNELWNLIETQGNTWVFILYS